MGKIRLQRMLGMAGGVLSLFLLASCAGLKDDKPAEKKDRFAFLRRDEQKPVVDKKESIEEERVNPEKEKKQLISDEKMKKLGVEAAPEIPDTWLLDAMKSLPEKYRISLYLYYYEEYSAREIAEVMGVSESAVGQYLTRGRRKLRTIITDEERRMAL